MARSYASKSRATGEGDPAAPAPAVERPPPGPEAEAADLVGNAASTEEARMHADEGPTGPTSFASKEAAVAHHEKIRECFGRVLDQAIAAGIDPEKGVYDEGNLLHNSAEWIQAGEATVHLLTPTHDAAKRGGVGKLAFFDATKNWNETGADYPQKAGVRNDPRLAMHPDGAHGQMNPGGDDLTLVNPVDADAIRHTLIHEVQHDADQTWKGQVWEEKRKSWDEKETADVNHYQSEFRAFWIMDGDKFPRATDKPKNAVPYPYDQVMNLPKPRFQNARQEAIFWDMVRYDSYEKFLWAYESDADFRAMVHAFATPVSGNLVNSVRIQVLSEKLTACKKESGLDSKEVGAALEAARGLDGLDRDFLADEKLSEPFWEQARAALSDTALAKLRETIASQ